MKKFDTLVEAIKKDKMWSLKPYKGPKKPPGTNKITKFLKKNEKMKDYDLKRALVDEFGIPTGLKIEDADAIVAKFRKENK